MTGKEQIFVNEYLTDLNQTRAYKVAYPNVKKDNVAAAAASRLLKKHGIREYIDEQLEKIKSEKVADAQEVMEYLTSVMRGESQSEEIVVEGCGDGYSEARKIEKAPSEKDKLKAAELLGKRYGMYTDRMKVDNDAENEKVQKLDNIASILNQMKPLKEGD